MRILYIEGDPCSPKYVAGSLRRAGHEVDARVQETFDGDVAEADLTILSDQPAKRWAEGAWARFIPRIRQGHPVLMIGGWTSFGRGGYAQTPLADLLPVELQDGDDRVARPSGAWLQPAGRNHPLVNGLPWDDPPVITGWNRLEPRAGAEVILEARDLRPSGAAGMAAGETPSPILVASPQDAAPRVVALATDLSPHWSGGWSDWGTELVDVTEKEQVGDAYLAFLDRLATWSATGRLGMTGTTRPQSTSASSRDA